MKKNWKILAIIALVITCVVGAVLGITLGGSGQAAGPERGKSTISVEGPNGASVEEVYVMLYDKDGKPLTKLPYVTNASGKIQYNWNVEEGSYAQVVAVPIGYKIDESVKWTFDANGEAKVAIDEDDTAFVAKIGEKKYSSLTVALATANASSEDVVVELLADVTFNTSTIKNNYNKTITVKGNGHTITSSGGNHAFLLEQAEGEVIFEDMTVVHNNYGSVFQMNSLMTLTVNNVVLDATKGSAYNYTLINTLGVDGTTTVNLTNVDAKMAVSSAGKSDQSAIIRTGNTSGTKNVVLNLKGCNFDTTEATGRCGIIVMKNTVADINIEDSNIVAGDAYAIWAMEQTQMQTMTAKNSTFVSTAEGFRDKAINGYTARMGNTYYLTFAHAAEVANVATTDTTISLVGNVTMKTCTINNVNGKTVTIDGGGNTLTTSGTSNAFVVGNKVAFQNLIVNHQNNGSVIQATEIAQITAKNVVINATEGEKYNYTLVNLMAEGEGSSIDFTNVDIKMAVDTKGLDGYASLIRTGNDAEVKKVAITLTNCNLDATGAEGRVGIAVTKNTTATITLNDTKIATKDAYVIRTNEQEVILNNATLTSLDEAKQIYPMEGYLAKIDNTFYTFAKALEVANAATTDTKITLLANYTIKEYTLNNSNGKAIEFDGNGYKITTNGGNNAFTIGKNVTFKNLAVNHKNQGSVFQITEAGKIVLDKVDISAKEGSKYNFALINIMPKDAETTLELNDVSAVMSVAGRGVADTAILRTGNNGDSKTVNISLTGCDFDTTKATGRAGILVMTKTTANITMTDTNIKTLDAPSVQTKESSVAQGIVIKNCNLDSVTTEYNAKNEPIRGYEAMVTKYEKPAATFTLTAPVAEEKEEDTSIKEAAVYARLHDAVDAVRYSQNDVKIDLMKDFTRGWQFSLKSDYGINILIDGNGHILTTKGGTNVFCVYDPNSVEIKDLTVKHTNSGAVVSIRDEVTGDVQVDLNNVIIEAVNPESNYDYALINILRSATVNLNKVEATMEVDKKGMDGYAAIIRTGNNVAEDMGIVKEVEINIVDSKLDTIEATNRNGIVIMRGTEANVTVENSKILTMDANAIRTEEKREGQLTVTEDSNVVSGKVDSIDKDFEIQVGDTWYLNEGMGILSAIENATEDTIIKVSEDLELDFNELTSTSDAKVTLEAGEFTITTTGEKDENIEIISDVVVASGDTTYYANVSQFTDVLNKVEDDTNVCINTDTSLNFDEVTNEADIEFVVDTNGYSLQVIGESAQNVTYISEVEYTSGDDVYYTTFKKAAVLGQTAEGDVVINLKEDATITSTATTTGATIKNSNGKHIVINGNNKTLIAQGGNCSLLIQKAASVTIKDITIKHENYGSALDINAATTVNLENVDIDATSPVNSESNYKYAIINFTVESATEKAFLNMKNVDVTMAAAKDGSDSHAGIIRTGNNGQTKTVEITMDGCTLDATGAAGRAGIRIMQNTTATIDLENTVIKTKDVSPIVNNGTGDTITKNGVVVSTGIELGVYATFEEALAVANAATSDVVVEFMANTDIESAVIVNTNGNKVIVDGNGYTITATGGDNGAAFVIGQEAHVGFIDVKIEASAGNAGISIKQGVAATINLANAEIKTSNASPISGIVTGVTVNENGHVVRGEGYLCVCDAFTDAVTKANAAATDVVLEMAGDVTITGTATKAGATFKNTNGNNITLDGKDHILTAKDGNCSLLIQNTGDVTIKNLTIKHENYGSAVDINATTTVNLENVDIDATSPANSENNYKYAIINFTVVSDTETAFLNMTNVEVAMASAKNGSDSHPCIIRTGNNDQTKTVVITMDGCTLDATEAAGRAGIRVMRDTTATIDLKNTVIKTNNEEPIINNGTGDTITKNGFVASSYTELGVYEDFSDAIEVANKSKGDVEVEIVDDITVSAAIIWNKTDGSVTINGNGHTITATDAVKDAVFVVDQNVPVTFTNTKIAAGTGSTGVRIKKETTINLVNTEISTTNVDPIVDESGKAKINKTGIVVSSATDLAVYDTLEAAIVAANVATSDVVVELNGDIDTFTSAIIENEGKTITVNGNGHKITATGGSNGAAFVVGQSKPVSFINIKLEATTGNAGISIEQGVVATINLTNTEIKTSNASVIDGITEGTIVNENGYVVRADGYLLVCDTFAETITAANGATENVVVELYKDTEITTVEINNTNNVTIDGKGYNITATGVVAFVVKPNASVTLSNIEITVQNGTPIVNESEGATIKENGYVVRADGYLLVCDIFEEAIEAANTATSNVVVEIDKDTTLTSNVIINNVQHEVTINGNNHELTLTEGVIIVEQTAPVTFSKVEMVMNAENTVADAKGGMICVGMDGQTKTATITLDGCTLDATSAAGVAGIKVMPNADATTVTLKNTEIKTENANAIEGTENIINLSGIVVSFGGKSAVYKTLKEAIAAANAATGDVVVELYENITLSESEALTIENANYKVTIEGNGLNITKEAGSAGPIFIVAQTEDVSFKNLKLDQQASGSAIEITVAGTINLDTVEINTVSASPIEANASAIIKKNGIAVSSDRQLLVCNDFAKAIEAANEVATDVVVEFNTDITLSQTLTLENDGAITLKGNGKTITTKDGSTTPIFIVAQTAAVSFENLKLNQMNSGAAIKVTKAGTINLENVEIKAASKNPIDNSAGASINMNGIAVVSADGHLAVYDDLAAAIGSANTATKAVVVELKEDATITSVNINNANKQKVTLEGNGKTITSIGGNNNHAFVVAQTAPVIFNDFTFVHKNYGSAIQVTAAGEVTLKDVTINATNPDNNNANYNYALINLNATGGPIKLTLEDTDITMASEKAGIDFPGIIRTGNAGQTKTVEIKLKGCTLDARDASGRAGIRIMENTTATIDLVDTEIKVNDECPIWDGSTAGATITRTDYKASSETHLAQVGNNLFTAFTGTTGVFNSEGIGANKIEDKNVVIEFLKDFEGSSALINNASGKTVTIEGNGHTLTTASNQNHTLRVGQTAPVSINNLTIVHRGYGCAVQLEALGTLNLTNVTIDATNPVNSNNNNYNYALINLTGTGGTINLNLTNTDITMASTITGKDQYGGIIRTGNDGDAAKTVNLTVKGCTLDATGATGRSGIIIAKSTTANVTVEDSEIMVLDDFPIMDRSAGKSTVNKIRTKIAITADAYKDYVALVGTNYPVNPDTGKTDESLFKNLLYDDLAYAIETVANGWTEGDVTVEVLKDTAIVADTQIRNAAGYGVTIDGNMYTIISSSKVAGQTPGNYNTFRIGKAQRKYVEFKNMTIDHRETQAILQDTDGTDKADELTIRFTDVTINAINYENQTYGYEFALVIILPNEIRNLEFTRVDIDMDAPGPKDNKKTAIISTGNANDVASTYKTLNVTLNDCNWDATGAAGRTGILLVDAVGTVTMNNSKIYTDSTSTCAAIVGYDGYESSKKDLTLIMDEKSLLQSGGSTAQADTIKGMANLSITGYPQDAAINAVGLDDEEDVSEETITITLQVPKSLYDLFIELIRQFAETYGWDLEL